MYPVSLVGPAALAALVGLANRCRLLVPVDPYRLSRLAYQPLRRDLEFLESLDHLLNLADQ